MRYFHKKITIIAFMLFSFLMPVLSFASSPLDAINQCLPNNVGNNDCAYAGLDSNGEIVWYTSNSPLLIFAIDSSNNFYSIDLSSNVSPFGTTSGAELGIPPGDYDVSFIDSESYAQANLALHYDGSIFTPMVGTASSGCGLSTSSPCVIDLQGVFAQSMMLYVGIAFLLVTFIFLAIYFKNR